PQFSKEENCLVAQTEYPVSLVSMDHSVLTGLQKKLGIFT
ncbi:uncharacterized protein METZ01_LOCUS367988, partial [marine metagenome]